MTAEFAALDDDAFAYAWREMSPEAQLALPGPVRAQAVERYRKLTPWVADTVKRAQRDMDAKDAKDAREILFDRGEPAVPPRRVNGEASQKPKAPRATTFPLVWLDEATEHSRGRGPVKGLIGPGELALVYGPSGSGKTFMTLDLVGHVATAMPWRGRRTSGGLVVYVAAEAGLSIMRRFVAWRDRIIPEGRETPVPLAIIPRGVNLLFPVELEELIADLRIMVAEAGPLALVVFDTLSRSIPGGDENGPDMTKVVGAADKIRDEFKAATLVVHHTGKDATKGARGNSSLVAAADTVLAVVDRVATLEKIRDGIAGESFAFELDVIDMGTDADGDPITTCIAMPTDAGRPAPRDREQRLTGVAKVALQALREAIEEHGETLPQTTSIPHVTRAVTLTGWRDRFAMRYGSDERGSEAVRKAFQRGKEALLKASAIGISDPYVWVSR